MAIIARVRKRDGRTVSYDESSIVRAIARAAFHFVPGDEAEDLGAELARSITWVLSREAAVPGGAAAEGDGSVLASAIVATRVEEALRRTGNSEVADAFLRWGEMRAERLSSLRIEGAPGGWSKGELASRLRAEGLEPGPAREVTRVVEDRLLALGLPRISSSLLREVVESEVSARGLARSTSEPRDVGIPAARLLRILEANRGRPAALEAGIAEVALERYFLDEVLASAVAVAHREGALDLAGIALPHRPRAAALEASAAAVLPEAPLASLVAALHEARDFCSGEITLLGLGALGLPPALAEALPDLLARPSLPGAALAVRLSLAPASPAEEATLAALLRRFERPAHGLTLLLERGIAEPSAAVAAVAREPAHARLAFLVEVGGADAGGVDSGKASPAARVVSGAATLNLVRVALVAGPGEREAFVAEARRVLALALEALSLKRRLVTSLSLLPALPLWTGPTASPPRCLAELMPGGIVEVLGFAGIAEALRLLTGESPFANTRVRDLGVELLATLAREARSQATRLGIALRIADDEIERAADRFEALDRRRFAREVEEVAPYGRAFALPKAPVSPGTFDGGSGDGGSGLDTARALARACGMSHIRFRAEHG